MIRIASGVVLASGFLALVFFGSPLLFFAFVEIAVIVCLFELYGMFGAGAAPCLKHTGVAAGAAISAILYLGDGRMIASMLGATLIIIIIVSLLQTDKKDVIARVSNTLFGALFVAVPLAALALLRNEPHGQSYVIIIVAANTLCDTFAYYTGRSFGKTRLAPEISPGKTVEGFAGGVAGALAGAVGAKLLLAPWLGIIHALAAGLLAGLIGPMGDLAESSIKRKMGVKDSGRIIPGHGGLLDRIDSLMFSSVSFYAYTVLFIVP